MIRIAAGAFEAIRATLAVGSVVVRAIKSAMRSVAS
jgi:hypothetical protein